MEEVRSKKVIFFSSSSLSFNSNTITPQPFVTWINGFVYFRNDFHKWIKLLNAHSNSSSFYFLFLIRLTFTTR